MEREEACARARASAHVPSASRAPAIAGRTEIEVAEEIKYGASKKVIWYDIAAKKIAVDAPKRDSESPERCDTVFDHLARECSGWTFLRFYATRVNASIYLPIRASSFWQSLNLKPGLLSSFRK